MTAVHRLEGRVLLHVTARETVTIPNIGQRSARADRPEGPAATLLGSTTTGEALR
jgi:hypothetical protein